jgi:uncharacterized Zn finger protein (UPF0148 family)
MRKPKIRCPSCGSSQAYIRIRTGQICCPECATITPKKESSEALSSQLKDIQRTEAA